MSSSSNDSAQKEVQAVPPHTVKSDEPASLLQPAAVVDSGDGSDSDSSTSPSEEAAKVVGEASAAAAAESDSDLWGVTVRLFRAHSLKASDLLTRSSDPFVILRVDGVAQQSQVVKHNCNPVFNETFTWLTRAKPKRLDIEVQDWDRLTKNESLGTTQLDLTQLAAGQGFDGELSLIRKEKQRGSVSLRVECTPLPTSTSTTSSTADLTGVSSIEDITSLVELKIVGAEGLRTSHKKSSSSEAAPPSTFATVDFSFRSFRTQTIEHSSNPKWNQLCTLWITQSDHNHRAILKLAVYEQLSRHTKTKTKLLGQVYLRPAELKMNHVFDMKLPLTLEDALTDAQLGVLLQDMKMHHTRQRSESPQPSSSSSESSSTSVSTSSSSSCPTSQPTSPTTDHGLGLLHVHLTIKPRQQAEDEFYRRALDQYDIDNDGRMDLAELTHMLSTVGARISPEEIESAFKIVDRDGDGALSVEELAELVRTPLFTKHHVLRTIFNVISYGKHGLESLLMKGCLSGQGINPHEVVPEEALDDTPTGRVNNAGTRLLVQDRETGLVVAELVPTYIKSALVLLNRTRMGRIASSTFKGTVKKLTVRQGKLMDSPKSKKDIPNFIKVHRLNVEEIERPLDEYRTFNEFFSRRLKPGARTCYLPGDDWAAVSPADCRMMVFRSLTDSTELWIKGRHFTLGRLFGQWDKDGRMAAMFNGGSLAIARLAPQDYHRWHYPVSGRLLPRFPISGDYITVSPIAVRQRVDVYTDNKRCIIPIETDEFGLVVMIAVGATMVGSIQFPCRCASQPSSSSSSSSLTSPSTSNVCCEDGRCLVGERVHKFDECGWFCFGGSTVLTLFQPGAIQFDEDLLKNSYNQLETLVKVGTSMGRATKMKQSNSNQNNNKNEGKSEDRGESKSSSVAAAAASNPSGSTS